MVEGTGTVSDEDESASSDDDDDIQIRDKAAIGPPIRIRNMKLTAGANASAGGVEVKPWA